MKFQKNIAAKNGINSELNALYPKLGPFYFFRSNRHYVDIFFVTFVGTNSNLLALLPPFVFRFSFFVLFYFSFQIFIFCFMFFIFCFRFSSLFSVFHFKFFIFRSSFSLFVFRFLFFVFRFKFYIFCVSFSLFIVRFSFLHCRSAPGELRSPALVLFYFNERYF